MSTATLPPLYEHTHTHATRCVESERFRLFLRCVLFTRALRLLCKLRILTEHWEAGRLIIEGATCEKTTKTTTTIVAQVRTKIEPLSVRLWHTKSDKPIIELPFCPFVCLFCLLCFLFWLVRRRANQPASQPAKSSDKSEIWSWWWWYHSPHWYNLI